MLNQWSDRYAIIFSMTVSINKLYQKDLDNFEKKLHCCKFYPLCSLHPQKELKRINLNKLNPDNPQISAPLPDLPRVVFISGTSTPVLLTIHPDILVLFLSSLRFKMGTRTLAFQEGIS